LWAICPSMMAPTTGTLPMAARDVLLGELHPGALRIELVHERAGQVPLVLLDDPLVDDEVGEPAPILPPHAPAVLARPAIIHPE
jgi:hypothetical protein